MAFFRSPLVRRIIYGVAIAVALVHVASRLHSEPYPDRPPQSGIVAHLAH